MKAQEMAGNMATMWYRLDCKDVTKGWSKDKKLKLAKKMSEVTLWDPKFHPYERKELWTFPEVPNRKFSALKLKSWMEQLCLDIKEFDVNPEVSKMVKAFAR
jgi:hypothetical protein